MNYNIAVIGPQDVISGFKALGATPFNASTAVEALEALKEIKRSAEDPDFAGAKFAVVFVIEHIYQDIPADEFTRVSRGALPAIIAVPGIEGASDAGIRKLRRLSEQAIGSDVLK